MNVVAGASAALDRTLATFSAKKRLKTSMLTASSQAYDLDQVNCPLAATVYVDQTGWLPPCRSNIPQTWCVTAGDRHDVD